MSCGSRIRRLRLVLCFFDEHRGTGSDLVADSVPAGRMKGDAQRFALPVGLCADGIGMFFRVEGGKLPCQNRLACSDLGHNRVEALAARRDTAIGAVVAE